MRLDVAIEKGLKQVFPNIEFDVDHCHDHFHSTIYFLMERTPYLELPEKIIIKKYKTKNSKEIICESLFMNTFYKKNNDRIVSSPLPLKVDPYNDFIIMKFLDGITIKNHLLNSQYKKSDEIFDYIDLSAIALSRFHTLFTKKNDAELLINSPMLNQFGETEIQMYASLLSKCNVQIKVQEFIDFAPQNLIINDNKIFLIDFPDRKCICSPHLDIARWKFEVLFLKQYPQFKILKQNWWDETQLCQQFIKKYCSEMNFVFNDDDINLINFFVHEHAKKLKQVYIQTNKIQLKLEYLYLYKFLNRLIHFEDRL